MQFILDAIVGAGSHDENRPLAVYFVTEQGTPEDEYVVNLAAKHLQSFASFQAAVADSLTLWLTDPTTGHSESERREEWHDMVSVAFYVGRKRQQIQNDAGDKREPTATEGEK